jgi:SAM-dependent methyltransferase
MRRSSASLLVLPGSTSRVIEVVAYEANAEQIERGALIFQEGWVPILRGVPVFVAGTQDSPSPPPGLDPERRIAFSTSLEQDKTSESFSDKWTRFKTYGFPDSHRQFLSEWYCKKLGLPDFDALRNFYKCRNLILEAGPGSGFNTRFMAEACPGSVVSLDISTAAATAYENTLDLPNCTVVQADLMQAPLADGAFDLIMADGVLHHTPDTRAAIEALYRKLAPGGQFFFYLYKKMGPARQFVDAHIRRTFTGVSPQDCYDACEGLTELGRELSRLGVTIRLEKPIPALGIPAGEHDVQRLIYYNFVKCFWNEAFDYETNNMINFDWYHPHHAWQHSRDEVEGWLDEMGVQERSFQDANPNGLSVLIRKPMAV